MLLASAKARDRQRSSRARSPKPRLRLTWDDQRRERMQRPAVSDFGRPACRLTDSRSRSGYETVYEKVTRESAPKQRRLLRSSRNREGRVRVAKNPEELMPRLKEPFEFTHLRWQEGTTVHFPHKRGHQ